MTYTDKAAIKVILLTLIALAAIPYYFIAGGTILGFILVRLIAHSIGMFTPFGYHRWLCHNSFEPNLFGKCMMAIAMVSSGQGSPLHYVVAHRIHHPHADTDNDPHPTTVGFWHLWLGQFKITEGFRPPRDFFRNKLAVFIHNHYWKLYALFNVTIFLVFDLKTALIYCPLNFAIGWTATIMLNYYGHLDPITKEIGPRNIESRMFNLIVAGDGLHANHHDNPSKLDLSGNGRTDPFIGILKLISKK